ncbi:MAG: ABC transporter substrate-binding protein [Gorillibacterium sp.]|nr:ABC transporter substrate-binding protein [Gorillibacterium sp.]
MNMFERKERVATTMKRLTILMLSLVLMLGLVGCGVKNAEVTASPTESASTQVTVSPEVSPSPEVSLGQTAYPLTVKDSTDTAVVFEQAPVRIVTLAPSETEIAFALGAGDMVFGVDTYSDYPEAAATKAKIGDMTTNLEAVIALKPDLVLAQSGLQLETVQKLRDLNIKVYATDPKSIDQVISKIEAVGQILNVQANAKQVTDKMIADRDRIVALVKDAPKKKVFLEFSPGWSVGKGEFLDELLTLAGGTNVAGEQAGWFEINPEQIIKADPAIIIYGKDALMGNAIYDEIMKRPGFDAITAVKNKEIYPVDSNLVSRVGPRLTDGLLEIAKAIHPDLVKD